MWHANTFNSPEKTNGKEENRRGNTENPNRLSQTVEKRETKLQLSGKCKSPKRQIKKAIKPIKKIYNKMQIFLNCKALKKSFTKTKKKLLARFYQSLKNCGKTRN